MKAIGQLLLVEYEVEASGMGNIRAVGQGHLGDGAYEMDIRCQSPAVPCKQITSCFSVGFSWDSSLCIKPVCGPAQTEDTIVYSVILSGKMWLAFEEHGLNHTWQFHHAKGLKGCQTVKATTGSCKFSVGERLGCLTKFTASKGFSVLFKYQQ